MTSIQTFFAHSASGVKNFAIHAGQAIQSSIPVIGAALKITASKIQELWTACQPYLKAGSEFLHTRTGATVLCLGGSLSCFCLAKESKSKLLAYTSFALGVIGAAAGAYLIMNGSLPTLTVTVQPVTL